SSPGKLSTEGFEDMLGEAAALEVTPGHLVWEPSGGFWKDAFYGRRVLFLASAQAGKPQDVYRARVRVTWSGKPISVERVDNLTSTPNGDDVGLVSNGTRVAF